MPNSLRTNFDRDSILETQSPSVTPFDEFLTRPVTPRLDGSPEKGIFKDAEYYLDTAIFHVEGTLFKVAKSHFLKSQDLAATFARCKSEHDVISLNDVSRDEFCTLLKLLYPLSIMSTNSFTSEEWIAVLKLSTLWKMLDIRNLAIRQLNVVNIDPIDRIILAQKYHIPQWLISSLISLIRREGSLSTDEAAKLGFELALKICRIRDSSRTLLDDLNDDTWNSAVTDEFQNELQLRDMSSIDQIVRARETGVLEFLRTSYLELVERPESLSNVEALELGCETTARICRIREQRIAQNLSRTSSMGLVEDELQAELGATTSLSAIQRVVVARNNVAQWLRMSLVETVQRRQFSSDEVESLGKETTIRLFRIREAVHSTQWGRKSFGVCRTIANKEFSDEIRTIRNQVKGYSGTEEASISAADEVVDQTQFQGELLDDNAHGEKEKEPIESRKKASDSDEDGQVSGLPAKSAKPRPPDAFKSNRPQIGRSGSHGRRLF